MDFKASIDRLDESNWTKWKRQIKLLLVHNGVWDIVSGEEPEPSEDAEKRELAEFEKKDSLGQLILVSHMNDHHVHLTATCNTAFEIWSKLVSVYEQSSGQRVDRLMEKFFTSEMKADEDIVSYVSRMQKDFADLNEELLKHTQCSLPDILLMSRIMSKLPSTYFEFKSVWESVPMEQRSINMLIERLRLIEMRLPDKSEERSGGTALTGKTNVTCFRCKQPGHYKNQCPQKPKRKWRKPARGSRTSNESTSMATKFGSLFTGGWIIDSGATCHMTGQKDKMFNFKRFETPNIVTVANNSTLEGLGCGDVKVNLKFGSKIISSVVYVPNLACNLLSVSQLIRKGFNVKFSFNRCMITCSKGNLIASGSSHGGVYILDEKHGDKSFAVVAKECQELWHRRLCHLNHKSMLLLKKRMANGINYDEEEIKLCEACVKGKHKRNAFPKEGKRTNDLLELVHSDLCGPMSENSHSGFRYLLLFIDDASRMTFGYYLKHKSETFEKFKEFKAFAELQTGKKLKRLRSDNGTEYTNNNFQRFLQ